jgi:uncharacterized protein (DUF427 family)
MEGLLSMKAIWNGSVIAASDDTVVVEGNHYFPAQSVDQALLVASDHTSVCAWKGTANYYSLRVGGELNQDAPGITPSPKRRRARSRAALPFGAVCALSNKPSGGRCAA